MIRAYDTDRPVPPEVLEEILRHATHAPSAGFSQAGRSERSTPRRPGARFWSAMTPPDIESSWLKGMRDAPVIIVPLSNKSAYLDRYAEPDKGWTDRDDNLLAGPLLAHRHRHIFKP